MFTFTLCNKFFLFSLSLFLPHCDPKIRQYSRSHKEMDTLLLPFSPSNLGQNGYPKTVLKSACHEDSKTPPTCLI